MDKKVTGIVAYITIIGWLIAYLAGDKEGAKFHLNQALVLAITALALSLLSCIPAIGFIFKILLIVVYVFEIIGFIYALQDQEKELPIIGKIQLLK